VQGQVTRTAPRHAWPHYVVRPERRGGNYAITGGNWWLSRLPAAGLPDRGPAEHARATRPEPPAARTLIHADHPDRLLLSFTSHHHQATPKPDAKPVCNGRDPGTRPGASRPELVGINVDQPVL